MAIRGLSASWFRRGLFALVVVGLVARGAVIVPTLGRLEDPDNYLPLARALAEGRGFVINGRPTAYRPPLYPIVLAPLTLAPGEHLGRGVAGLHLLLGGATVALTAWTARRWGLSRGRALAAAAIVACDPVLVVQARAVMTETFSAFLLAATLAALTVPGRRRGGAGGPRIRPGLAVPPERPAGPGAGGRGGLRDGAGRLATTRPDGGRPGGGGRRDAGPLGLAECAGPGRAGLDDHAWRLHPGAGEQSGLLRRGPRRPPGRGLVGPEPAAVVGRS